MTVRVELVQVAASTAGGTQDITFPGLGSSDQLRVAVFWWSRAVNPGATTAHAQLGMGWATSSGETACTACAQHAVVNSQAASLAIENASVVLGNAGGGMSGAAQFGGWVTDGVRLDWVDPTNNGQLLNCLLIADDGNDVQVSAGRDTAPNFGGELIIDTGMLDVPELVLAMGTQGDWGVIADGNAARTDGARLGVGWCVNKRTGNAGLMQHALSWGAEDDVTPSDSWRYTLDGNALGRADANQIRGQYLFRDFGLDGPGTFRMSGESGSGAPFAWLAVTFNRTVDLWSETVSTPTVTGNASEDGGGALGPLQAVLFGQTIRTAGAGYEVGGAMAIGAMTSGGAGSSAASAQDSVNPTLAVCATASGSPAYLLDDNNLLAAAADPSSTRFPAGGGYSLNWTTAPGTSLRWPVLAFGAWAASPPAAAVRADSGITARLTRRRRLSTSMDGGSTIGPDFNPPSVWPPSPPEPDPVAEPTPAQVQYIVERLLGAGTDTVLDVGSGNTVLTTTNRGLQWLAQNGYLQSDDGSDVVVGVRGIVGASTNHTITGGQGGTKIENVVHIVAMNPGPFVMDDNTGDGWQVLGLGQSSGGFKAIHLWRCTGYNPPNSFAPIFTVDNESTPSGQYHEPAGLIGVHFCKFTGLNTDSYNWGNSPPGEGFPAKWWINGKGAASWWIRGNLFPDVLEHHHYCHYAQAAWIESNTYSVTGGTCGQFVSRAGRLIGYGFLHGNPYWPPAGSAGPLVFRNNVHDDRDSGAEIFRDGGSLTIVGWLNDIYAYNNEIKGTVAAGLTLWADSFKGMYLLPTEHEPLGIYRGRSNNPNNDNQDTTPGDPPVHRKTHGRVFLHNWSQEFAEHDNREQTALSGAQSVEIGRATVASAQPGIMLNTRYGGPWRNGFQVFMDAFAAETWQATDRIGTWEGAQGPTGSNVFWGQATLETMLADNGPRSLLEAGSSIYGTLRKRTTNVRGTSQITLTLRYSNGARMTAQSAIRATLSKVPPPPAVTGELAAASSIQANLGRRRAAGSTVQGSSGVRATLRLATVPGTSDDFNAPNLDTGLWEFVNPLGDSFIRMTGTGTADAALEIEVPEGVDHIVYSDLTSPHVVQAVDDTDFTVVAKFDSLMSQAYQGQGIVVLGGPGDRLRFDIFWDNTRYRTFSAIVIGGSASNGGGVNVTPTPTTSMWVMVQRVGDTWTQFYSVDGTNWTQAATFVQAFGVQKVGVFSLNSRYQANTPAHTAIVDYFEFTADPLSAEDSTPEPDTRPPLVHSVQTVLGHRTIQVTWATDEPASGFVEYGTTTDYELGRVQTSGTAYSQRVALIELDPASTYHFRVVADDGASGLTIGSDQTATTLDEAGSSPLINLWYGQTPKYGQIGLPQNWMQVHGNASSSGGVGSIVSYLNGGAPVLLDLGTNSRRLEKPGDFIAEYDFGDLVEGTNELRLMAVDAVDGTLVSEEVVKLSYQSGNTWPLTYTADWGAASRIDDVAQVVDGKWSLPGAGVLRLAETGYDRLVAFGDAAAWTDYEAQAVFTIHSVDPVFLFPANPGPSVGFLLRWIGHSPTPPDQPAQGWVPLGTIACYQYGDGFERLELQDDAGPVAVDDSGKTLSLETRYIFMVRVETAAPGQGTYSIKVWEEGQAEPPSWDLSTTVPGDIDAGSLCVLLHYADASVEQVQVTPLTGGTEQGLATAAGTSSGEFALSRKRAAAAPVTGASTMAGQLGRRRAGPAVLSAVSGITAIARRLRGAVATMAGVSNAAAITDQTLMASVSGSSAISAKLSRRRRAIAVVEGSSGVQANPNGTTAMLGLVSGQSGITLELARRRSATATTAATSGVSALLQQRQLTSMRGTTGIQLRLGRRRRLFVTVAGESSAALTSGSYEAPLTEGGTFQVRLRVSDLEPSSMVLHQGDVGVVFEGAFIDEKGAPITVPETATVTLRLQGPQGDTTLYTGSLAPDAGPNIARYTSQPGDLALWGVWKAQWSASFPGGQQWSTSIRSFKVRPNLNA